MEPTGIASDVIAVAIARSLSANHLLQITFWAQRKIGLAREIIIVPVRMGQNWFVSKKEIIRSQLPKVKTKLANRKMFAVE
jgi:hypothetical protein